MNDLSFIYIALAITIFIIFAAILFFKRKNTSSVITIQSNVEVSPKNTPSVHFQDHLNTPITIQKIDESLLTSLKPIETNEKLTSYSNEILQLAKTNIPFLSKKKGVYEVVFSESVQNEIKNGSLRIMDSKKDGYKRATAVNNRGTIVENANLKPLKNNPAQIKALAMNTLTVVV
ncbi:hypothetical protein JOD29_003323 [Lysinibacillus composti]|uniref:Uncharacterized protein n=1 Tax=Lysinibacillus composti TaxID=720633 RepID=A0A3N9UN42_9BACI|nr:hypothetical protein [Lysinibacillus composti]MBM7610045.1 hypothetical protein [Lysinibacillus composti]RQW73306.1 hypothetical protein EBB45_17290 [Lysinibacillus composti]